MYVEDGTEGSCMGGVDGRDLVPGVGESTLVPQLEHQLL